MSKTNPKSRNRKHRSDEEGVALIAAILTLLLIAALTAGIIILTNTETTTSTNFKDEQRAFFSAKAGIEEARDRLRSGIANYTLATLPSTLPGNGATGVLYILNPLNGETVAPWCGSSSPVSTQCTQQYPDDELCNETLSSSSVTCTTDSTTGKKYASGSYYITPTITASTTLAPSSGPVLDWKWVRIQMKQSNAFGANYAVNGSNTNAYYTCLKDGSPFEVAFAAPCVAPTYLPVYVLTALAVTPSGTRRMVQVEVGHDTIQFNAPAALTVDGAGPSFTGGDSQNFGISGIDVGGCGSTAKGAPVPAVGVVTNADVTTVSSSADIPKKTDPNYTGSGGTTPDVENVSALLQSNLTTTLTLQDLASTLKADVTQPVINGPKSYSGGGSALNSSLASPQIVYVNGDLTLTGSQVGYGILVVTGTLTLKGTVTWNGLILVVGNGNLQMDGTNTINGAALVADTLNSTGSVLSVLGPPTYGVNGGGNAFGGVYYSGNCLAQATKLSTYHVISMRELMN